MNLAIFVFCACFTICGLGIPLGIPVIFDPRGEPLVIRLFIAFLVLVWCATFAITIHGLIKLAAQP